MTSDVQSAREDLAFLRSLVGEDESAVVRALGQIYFLAGLIFGAQLLLYVAQAFGWLVSTMAVDLMIGIGPSLVFVLAMLWRGLHRRLFRPAGGVGRSLGAVFRVTGAANLVLIAIIGSVAWREHSITTWLIYPCSVFVLQGSAWFVAFLLRRRAWLALVAAGWFGFSIAMALTVTSTTYFVLFAGVGLLACMTIPGWLMMRSPRVA